MCKKLVLTLFCLTIGFTVAFCSADEENWQSLEKSVQKLNDEGNYVKSLQEIDHFLSDKNRDPYSIYHAYLQKSFTYKRLFDYEDVFLHLELALKAGMKSDRKSEVEARVKAEKAFAYFDIHQFIQANELMQQLRKTDYQNLSGGVISYLEMQQGYLEMLNFNYPESKLLLNESLDMMKKHSPRNTPMVYGKLIALNGKMGNEAGMLEAFQLGLNAAKQYNILKYEIYMYECLRDQYAEMKAYKEAFNAYQIVDSLNIKYDAATNLNLLKSYEKEYAILEKEVALKQHRSTRNMLIVVIAFISVLAIVLYRLYKSRQQELLLLEKEYDRIRFDLEQMTQQVNHGQPKKSNLKEMNLSARQLEVIEFIKKGYSNKQIGAELFISENTVKYHLKAIYELLQVGNRTELFHLYSSESKSEMDESDS